MIRPELEPGDDPRIVAGRKLGNPRGDPRVFVLRIGDDVGIAPGARRQDPGRLLVRVAEGVQTRPPLGTEQEVPRGELLLALEIAEGWPAAEDEEHLLGAV